MTDYTNFDTILKKSTNVGGLDEIHEHILDLTKQYEALKTNETVREELIVDMKAELKSLHKKLDLANGSNNPLNLKDKGFGFHSSGSPRSKPYHELLSDSFKKLKEDNEKLKKQIVGFRQEGRRVRAEIELRKGMGSDKQEKEIKKLKEKESVVDEVFEGLKKNEKEYIHRNNILQRENEKLKEDKFNYNVFLEEKKNMVILMEKQKEENKGLVQQIHNGLNAQVEVEKENEELKKELILLRGS